jgi:hypothetical protein
MMEVYLKCGANVKHYFLVLWFGTLVLALRTGGLEARVSFILKPACWPLPFNPNFCA